MSGAHAAAPTRRPVGLEEQRLPHDTMVQYLYQPGKLEGYRCRATDPVWSLMIHWLTRAVAKTI